MTRFHVLTIFPEVFPGPLGVGHPAACRAFDETATAAGATVEHGVERVTVTAGASPAVTYVVDGREHVPRVVVWQRALIEHVQALVVEEEGAQ